MDGPALTYAALQEGAFDVRDAAGRLRTERNAVRDAYLKVVGGDWTGTAAASFKTVLEDWNTGLTDVEEGLAEMSELIEAAMEDFQETDAQHRSNLDAVAARLNDRLGG